MEMIGNSLSRESEREYYEKTLPKQYKELVFKCRGLQDQLHRRNALIKKLRANYNRVINSLSTEQLNKIFNLNKKEPLK